jgi:DNA modification methylase
MLELNKLYNMDCMQGMKEFPDGFFDLAIVDPPYGIGIDGQNYSPARILPRIGTRFKSASDMGRKLLRSVS